MTTNTNTFLLGFSYFFKGFSVYREKGMRRYAYLPLFINTLIFGVFFYFGFDYIQGKIAGLMHYTVPDYLSFLQSTVNFIMAGLKYVLIVLVGLGLLLTIGLSASIIANLVASPFNALLSEKIDYKLTGYRPPNINIAKVAYRSIAREVAKLFYTAPRLILISILFLIFYFIPGLNLIASLLFTVFGAWMLAFEYLDYTADNRQIPIKSFKKILKQHQSLCYGFGAACMIFTSIPVLNLIVIPVAVSGASQLWGLALHHTEDQPASAKLPQT